MDIIYEASHTLSKFHKSDKFVRGVRGPIGSGKSVACCWEIMMKAHAQEPFLDNDGKLTRRSRWVIIRNSYRELIDTTIKTWEDWFPVGLGVFRQIDMTWTYYQKLPDGTYCYLEILYRALDKPKDVKKLLSLELTGAWINEAREIPKAIVDMVQGRIGRYPNKRMGGPTWFGLIMDTNPPDSDHWWFTMFEANLPSNWAGFSQPSGKSDSAENIENLPPLYYDNMLQGKDQEWINVYVHGEYGFVSDGLPVIPEFHDHVHVSQEPFDFDSEILYIGVDFGRTPAAVFAQEINGQVQIVDELITFGIGATHFAQLLKERIKGHYPNAEVVAIGDPAGDNPGEQVDDTCIEILQNAGIPIDPAHTNNFTTRREAVAISLQTLNMQGEPLLMVSPKCTMLRKALGGGYKYRRMQVSGEVFQMKPDKNKYSHVADALQYLMLGMGRGYDVVSSHSDIGKYKVVGAL